MPNHQAQRGIIRRILLADQNASSGRPQMVADNAEQFRDVFEQFTHRLPLLATRIRLEADAVHLA